MKRIRILILGCILVLLLCQVFETEAKPKPKNGKKPKPNPPKGNNKSKEDDGKKPKGQEKKEEDVDVFAEMRQSDSPSGKKNPGKLMLGFFMDSKPMTVNVEENINYMEEAPVFIGKNKGIAKDPHKKKYAIYANNATMASIFVQHPTTQEEDFQIDGTFFQDGYEYTIKPMKTKAKAMKKVGKKNQKVMTNKKKYKVIKRKVSTEELYNTLDTRGEQETTVDNSTGTDPITSYDFSSGRISNGVRTLIAIDYALYSQWLALAEETTEEERKSETLDRIMHYYTHVAHGVDMRYKSIIEPDYEIYVKLAGIYIATTPQDAPFTEDSPNKVPGSRGTPQVPGYVVDADKGLTAFEKWTDANRDMFPEFQQATLFTGYRVYRFYTSGTNRPINGLADIAKVCTYLSASINRDNGLFASTQTAAHEMGHNLGSLHDGTNGMCTSRDQYVMANAPGYLAPEIYDNPFKFSSCSVFYFRSHLTQKTTEGKNCLLSKKEHTNPNEVIHYLNWLPGQRFTPDEQCQQLYGRSSYYCAGDSKDICSTLSCFDPDKDMCFHYVDQRALEGTSCRNQSICIKGHCEYDEKAPTNRDKCLYGDYKGVFHDGMTCEDYGRDSPWKCYEAYIENHCCDTCGKLKNVSNKGCEYKDHSSYCKDRKRGDCYEENTKNQCCDSCAKWDSGVKDCEFGDRASWCSDVRAYECYFEYDTCCEGCVKHKTNNTNCEYGDKLSWCSTISPRDCYSEDRCCATCSKHETGIPRCEYGDRSAYCSNVDCTRSENWDKCCYTCRDNWYSTTTSTTTTTTTTTPPPTTTTTSTTTTTTQQPTTTTTTTTTRPTVTASQTTTTKQPTTTTCQDHASWCSDIGGHDCYSVNETCCLTCQALKVSESECMYGDKVSWCPDYATERSYCEDVNINKTCCATCPGYYTTTPVTTTQFTLEPCQDQVTWCGNYGSHVCYSTAEDACCNTCKQHYTGIPGCEYKDRVSWCADYAKTAADCSQEDMATNCCYTCANL